VAHGQNYDSTFFHGLKWRNVTPNRGGRVTSGVGVPNNPRIYYMGASGGGVWKTEDAGTTWKNVSDGFFKTGSVGDIAVFNGDPSIVYVGMGEGPVRSMMSSYGDGMYKSTDAGKTWKHLGLERTRQISRVIVHPTNANIVYVAAQGTRWGPSEDRGIYRSTDGGATWSRVLFVSPTTGATELEMDPTNPAVIYATTWDMVRMPWALRSGGPGSGVWKTVDGGDHWTRLTKGLPSVMGRIGLGIAPATPTRVYALVEADSGGMYRTDDSGDSWRRVSTNRGLQARPWYFMTVTVDPKNSDVVYAPGFMFLKSTDGGATFATRPSPHSDNHRLWINPTNPRTMLLAHDGGATVSLDGGDTWSPTENQATAQFYAVQMDSLFPYNLYAGQQDASSLVMPSRDLNGETTNGMCRCWRQVGGGESARFAFNPMNPDVIYATGFLGEMHRLDQKTGLQRSVTEFPGGQHLGTSGAEMAYRFNWSAPLAWSPFDHRVIYHGANVLFRSTDGDHWIPMSPDLTRNDKSHQGRSGPFWHDGSGGEIYNTIYAIVESPRERGTIWVGTDDGLVQLTRDSGKTWKNVTPASWGEGMIETIDVGHSANGTAYVAFSRHKFDDVTPHFFVTHDYGATWKDLATSLPLHDQFARVIREDPVQPNLLFAATEYALWTSFNGGQSWESFQHGVPITPISDIQVYQNDLVVATEGRGFWIMDDISPLRELTPTVAGAPLYLFKVSPAIRLSAGARSGGAAGGAAIRFAAGGSGLTDSLALDILDSAGTVVRNTTVSVARGINEYRWDLRGREAPDIALHPMPSGHYSVRAKLAKTILSQPLSLVPDPRAGGTAADEREHGAMVRALSRAATDIGRTLIDLRDIRTQARAVTPRDSALDSMISRIDSLEALVVNKGSTREMGGGPLDIMDMSPRLQTDVNGLLGAVNGTSAPVTSGEREQFARLQQRSAAFLARSNSLLTTELQRVNARLQSRGATPLIIHQPPKRSDP
jgi:photosystem II stability/assembly factor-like uncharacterized protein